MDELQTTPAPIYVTAPSPDTAKTSGSEATDQPYESNTIRPVPIVIFGLGLVLMTLVVLALMAGVYQLFLNQAIASDPPLSALADSRQPPAEPRLQVAPGQELTAMQDEENAILYSYGWVDQDAGIVRLPITRAMELLVERGLPVRGDTDPWL